MLPQAAAEHYDRQQRLSLLTVAGARRLWARLGQGDFDVAWLVLGPQLFALLSAAQLTAARESAAYVATVLDELGIAAEPVAALAPASLAGVASSGSPLADVLYQPVIQTRTALGDGADMKSALQSGRNLLDGIMQTQVADAGRDAESVAITARPTVTGYVRMLSLPSCDRCAVLAGRHYRWSSGFLRHPRCDCRHIPATEDVAGDLTTDPRKAIESGQVTGLSKADHHAIVEDGADPGRVINAKGNTKSGLSTAQVGGRKVKTTTVGYRGKPRRQVRLRPESIYRIAGDDRAEALRLLKVHGYLI